jgi:LPS-assembly protein
MLCGAALCALATAPAFAQEPPPASDVVTFKGDGQATASEDGAIALEGNVELNYRGRTLRADRVSLDPNTETVRAEGDVELYQPDGTVGFADSLVFTDDLTTGVARGFSARLPENGTIVADSLIQRDENFAELNSANFTTCDTCDDTGAAKTPTWSIEADKVVRDEADKSINYRNALVRIKGVPVFYTPFFSHADPTADRRSGLLAPDFTVTRRRGLTYEQPILWSISPHQDLVISPQLNTRVNPFLNLEYRRRFYTGIVEARTGATRERGFNFAGQQFGDEHTKAYVLAYGAFEPNADWRWGFTAEAARDRRLFDQYSIDLDRTDRGLFRADDRRLISQVYAVRQTQRSYLSVAALGFQSLRPIPGAPTVAGVFPLESNDVLPFVAPLGEVRFEPEGGVLGGRLRVLASTVAVSREDSPNVAGWPGIDSRRGTLELDWRRALTLRSGVRVEPFAHLRGDAYSVQDLTLADPRRRTSARAIPTAGVDVSWPFVRQSRGVTTIVEPIIQIAASPDTKIDPDIPNEDSVAFDFDDTNLFEFNKYPGYDLYEGGQRINVGVVTSVDWGEDRSLRVVVGQSFRDDRDPAFPPRTGLDQKASDWVVGAEVKPVPGLAIYTRARLDDFDLQRVEGGLNASFDRGAGYVRYMQTDRDYQGLPREDIEGGGEVFLTPTWGVIATAVRDIELSAWRRRSFGLVYRDECLRFELLYQRDNNPVLGDKASQSIAVRLTLVTLGDTGYRDYGRRRP